MPEQQPWSTGIYVILSERVSVNHKEHGQTNKQLLCTLDFTSWHSPNWNHNYFRGKTKCPFQIKTCPCSLWNIVCMTLWAIRASGSHTYSCTGGRQKYSLRCYCTSCTHHLLTEASVRSNQTSSRTTLVWKYVTWQSRETLTTLSVCMCTERWRCDKWQIRSCQSH